MKIKRVPARSYRDITRNRCLVLLNKQRRAGVLTAPKQDVSYLASDALDGRRTGTGGRKRCRSLHRRENSSKIGTETGTWRRRRVTCKRFRMSVELSSARTIVSRRMI